jgi:3-oxoacyl-[acyl-carrier protein] reductase
VNEHRNLQGRVAVVTGSARNIGRAIARALADAGAAVVINAKSSTVDAEALIDAAIVAFGRLDILVNNAAVRREIDFEKLDYQEWRAITATILDGAYLCAHAAAPHLIAAGGGSIVNIGGLSSATGATRRAHVIAAKAGLVGLTRALAHDLAPHRITVNCVAPGLIDTARRGPEPAHHAKHATLVGRRGTPEEVAAVVRFLCGPEARYITGQTLHANGGVFMA